MNVSISQEEREVLNDLKVSIVQLNSFVIHLSWGFLLSIYDYFLAYLISLKEFAPSEIKKHGLEQILIKRALRFFGLEVSETIKSQGRNKQVLKGSRRFKFRKIGKRFVKLVAFPAYVLILIIIWSRSEKDVKNKFKT